MNKNVMLIDKIPVPIEGEKNILELCRKAGIDMPTFCYYSELSVYGACRMCMVEDDRGNMHAACSTPPKAGMSVVTNSARLRKYRKNILELLLANHCRDCTTCEKSEGCKLKVLARRFYIEDVRFPNGKTEPQKDESSVSISIDHSKCILCGDCVRMCNEVQNVGAIAFIGRGSHMEVGTAFNVPINDTNCVGCGQCSAVCPTGAIVVQKNVDRTWAAIYDPNVYVVAQIAPAVRVGIAKELGEENGFMATGKIFAAMRRMGFNRVFDTTTGADMTVVEEGNEFIERLGKGEKLPLFTSCCPAWIRYAESKHPELLENISSCRSPMQMFGSVIKEHYENDPDLKGKKIFSIAVMPCTAKKYEAIRPEFKRADGTDTIDAVITTQELVQMIREAGIHFDEIQPESPSLPFGGTSGAGVIFGVTGGVTEAVLRYANSDKTYSALREIAQSGVRGLEGVKEMVYDLGETQLKIAMVSGLGNAEKLIQKIQAGEVEYHLVEVMACPNGCVSGGGQPFAHGDEKQQRADNLYKTDGLTQIKRSEENPILGEIYARYIGSRSHELLHVHYHPKHED